MFDPTNTHAMERFLGEAASAFREGSSSPRQWGAFILDRLRENGLRITTDPAAHPLLLDRLDFACIGSCTCLTKTHEPAKHDVQCHYRLFSDCRDAFQRIANLISSQADELGLPQDHVLRSYEAILTHRK